MPRKPSRSTLIKNADLAMSRYVRLRDADFDGYVYCVTCGKPMYWEKDGAQAGHFKAKGNGASRIRWIPHNVHVQCDRCNRHNSSMGPEYSAYMIKNYGPEFIDDLIYRKMKPSDYTNDELKEIAQLYHFLANIIETDKTLLGFTYD